MRTVSWLGLSCFGMPGQIQVLKTNGRHENIISILDIISPPSYAEFTEVYLVQELMETDL